MHKLLIEVLLEILVPGAQVTFRVSVTAWPSHWMNHRPVSCVDIYMTVR